MPMAYNSVEDATDSASSVSTSSRGSSPFVRLRVALSGGPTRLRVALYSGGWLGLCLAKRPTSGSANAVVTSSVASSFALDVMDRSRVLPLTSDV